MENLIFCAVLQRSPLTHAIVKKINHRTKHDTQRLHATMNWCSAWISRLFMLIHATFLNAFLLFFTVYCDDNAILSSIFMRNKSNKGSGVFLNWSWTERSWIMGFITKNILVLFIVYFSSQVRSFVCLLIHYNILFKFSSFYAFYFYSNISWFVCVLNEIYLFIYFQLCSLRFSSLKYFVSYL